MQAKPKRAVAIVKATTARTKPLLPEGVTPIDNGIVRAADKIAALASDEDAAREAGDEERANALFADAMSRASKLAAMKSRTHVGLAAKGRALLAITRGEHYALADRNVATLALSIATGAQRVAAV